MPPADRQPSGPFFSEAERRLFIITAALIVGIFSSLAWAGALVSTLRSRGILDMTFLCMFLLLMTAIVAASLRFASRLRALWLGIAVAAVTGLLFVRSGIPVAERSHLIEYGLVAVLIYHALLERRRAGGTVAMPASIAIGTTASVGALDEAVQLLLPSRVFDVRDLLFNAFAGCLTVGLTAVLSRFGSAERGKDQA